MGFAPQDVDCHFNALFNTQPPAPATSEAYSREEMTRYHYGTLDWWTMTHSILYTM